MRALMVCTLEMAPIKSSTICCELFWNLRKPLACSVWSLVTGGFKQALDQAAENRHLIAGTGWIRPVDWRTGYPGMERPRRPVIRGLPESDPEGPVAVYLQMLDRLAFAQTGSACCFYARQWPC